MGTADNQPLISVIVPVYKVEEYLTECIDSIIAQTYQNLEIILVDDGSPDNCPVICDEYAKKDSRICVIHKENGGLSEARNVGLSVCTGEYIAFVDSDDSIVSNAIEVLYCLAIEYKVPLVIGGYQRCNSISENIYQPNSVELQVYTKTEAMADMLQNGCASWGRIYHKSIHNGIHFPVGEINEDEAVVLEILNRCERIVVTNQILYRYRFRPESITSVRFSEKKMDWYWHCKYNNRWIIEHYPELKKFSMDRLGSSIVYILHQMALNHYYNWDLSRMLLGDLRDNYFEYSKYYLSGKKEKCRMFILCFFPYYLYCAIIALFRRQPYENK